MPSVPWIYHDSDQDKMLTKDETMTVCPLFMNGTQLNTFNIIYDILFFITLNRTFNDTLSYQKIQMKFNTNLN